MSLYSFLFYDDFEESIIHLMISFTEHSRRPVQSNLELTWVWQANKHLAKVYIRQTGHSSEVRGQHKHREVQDRENEKCTHSTYLAHCAGSDMAIKQQLVKIVHIMKRLNKVRAVKTITPAETQHVQKTSHTSSQQRLKQGSDWLVTFLIRSRPTDNIWD